MTIERRESFEKIYNENGDVIREESTGIYYVYTPDDSKAFRNRKDGIIYIVQNKESNRYGKGAIISTSLVKNDFEKNYEEIKI